LLLPQFNPAMNPWKSPSIRAYMQAYYAAALQWLQRGAVGAKWRVKGVFAWNLVSWDVQGVHPLSYAGDGGSFKGEHWQTWQHMCTNNGTVLLTLTCGVHCWLRV
jgi:hypothetical protein